MQLTEEGKSMVGIQANEVAVTASETRTIDTGQVFYTEIIAQAVKINENMLASA